MSALRTAAHDSAERKTAGSDANARDCKMPARRPTNAKGSRTTGYSADEYMSETPITTPVSRSNDKLVRGVREECMLPNV